MEKLAVLGAGSWGTTLADMLASKGYRVSLWARSPELCRGIKEQRENRAYLPGVTLSGNIEPCADLAEALKGAAMVVSVVPSHGLRDVMRAAKAHIQKGAIVVSATKGIEEGTRLTPSGIINESLAGCEGGVVVLSGPSFASEVSKRLPAAVCAASNSPVAAGTVQKVFSTQNFRVYTNTDVVGVEVGGALKNVIAISSGISDGLSLGNNARAALITRGLAEISRLGIRMGANPLTFAGLSGLGDLVLTCTGALSRNYSVGFSIGQGRHVGEILGNMKMVAEGVKTSRGALDLAGAHGVEMPITREVYNVVHSGKPARQAVMELMKRDLKGE